MKKYALLLVGTVVQACYAGITNDFEAMQTIYKFTCFIENSERILGTNTVEKIQPKNTASKFGYTSREAAFRTLQLQLPESQEHGLYAATNILKLAHNLRLYLVMRKNYDKQAKAIIESTESLARWAQNILLITAALTQQALRQPRRKSATTLDPVDEFEEDENTFQEEYSITWVEPTKS